MSWTAMESAVWIRGSVQGIQAALEDFFATRETPIGIVKNGEYDAMTHEAFRKALGMYATNPTPPSGRSAIPEVAAQIYAAFDDQGPQNLAYDILGVGEQEARDFGVAWAWWNSLRASPKSRVAMQTIKDYNDWLHADGNQPLLPGTAEFFVGDKPLVTSSLVIKAGIGVVAVIAAGLIGWKLAERRQMPALPGKK